MSILVVYLSLALDAIGSFCLALIQLSMNCLHWNRIDVLLGQN